jgi:hypothetical protein
MRKTILLLSVIALAAASLGLTARAASDGTRFRAELRGLNEVPPTNSKATGTLTGQISDDGTSLTFTLTFSGLTANPAVAHIHFGPTRVSGGVMVFFCGGGGKPACPASTSGTVTGTIMAADIVGPAGQGIPPAPNGQFSDVVRAIRTGNGYANMHNANFPAGEIRGQLHIVDEDHNDD